MKQKILWDKKWKELLKRNGMSIWLYARYMDDGRVVLNPIRPGWRWVKGGLHFCVAWVKEDALLTPLERTRRALGGSMQEVVSCLTFTTETGVPKSNTNSNKTM